MSLNLYIFVLCVYLWVGVAARKIKTISLLGFIECKVENIQGLLYGSAVFAEYFAYVWKI